MTKAEQPFDKLYDRHFEAIFRYVLRRVANVAEAEDLTAQTFYKALRHLSGSDRVHFSEEKIGKHRRKER